MAENNVTETTTSNSADFNVDAFKTEAIDAFERNKNVVYGGLALVLGVAGLLYFYFGVYKPNQNAAANDAIYQAQFLYERDSFQLALSGVHTPGQPEVVGFLDIIDQYSGTDAANLANYYAGISLLQLGKFEESVKFLQNYSGTDALTQAMAYGAIGDAKSELGQMDEALSFYEKAANFNPNEATSPYFLLRAGKLSEHTGKKDEAQKYYERIQKEYPAFGERVNIENELIRLTGKY